MSPLIAFFCVTVSIRFSLVWVWLALFRCPSLPSNWTTVGWQLDLLCSSHLLRINADRRVCSHVIFVNGNGSTEGRETSTCMCCIGGQRFDSCEQLDSRKKLSTVVHRKFRRVSYSLSLLYLFRADTLIRFPCCSSLISFPLTVGLLFPDKYMFSPQNDGQTRLESAQPSSTTHLPAVPSEMTESCAHQVVSIAMLVHSTLARLGYSLANWWRPNVGRHSTQTQWRKERQSHGVYFRC